jgi:hypothetical protein
MREHMSESDPVSGAGPASNTGHARTDPSRAPGTNSTPTSELTSSANPTPEHTGHARVEPRR